MNETTSTENQQNDEEIPSTNSNEPIGDTKKILIIEDDPTTTELLRKILVEQHFEVFEAKNGKDAWDKIRPETTPDIIISDFIMPEMNGFQFFKGLKENNNTKNIPIIFLSARKNMEDSLLASGVDAFLAKPINTTLFLETIKKLLSRIPIKKEPEKNSEEKPEETKS